MIANIVYSCSVRSCHGEQPWTVHILWLETRGGPPSTEQRCKHASSRYTVNPNQTQNTSVTIGLYQHKHSVSAGMQCIPQRAALLKSMLNFLKKAIQDPAFSDGIRHGESFGIPFLISQMNSTCMVFTTLGYTC